MSSKKIYTDLIIKKKVVTPIDPLNWPNSSSPHRFNLAELCKLKKIMFYTKKIEYNIIVTIKLILKNLIIFQLIFCPNQYDIYFQRYSLKIIQDITLWCSCKLILLYNC